MKGIQRERKMERWRTCREKGQQGRKEGRETGRKEMKKLRGRKKNGKKEGGGEGRKTKIERKTNEN